MASWLRPFVRKHIFAQYKRAVSALERRRYLAQASKPRLNLGCGSNILQGWYNTDLYPGLGASRLDFSRPLPFADGTFEAVHCEHTIEHVPKSLALYMCREVLRVLKKGGRFRVVTPGLELLARLVEEPGSAFTTDYVREFHALTGENETTAVDMVNDMFYGHGHLHLYSAAELECILRDIGFAEVTAYPLPQIGSPVFEGADGHHRVVGEMHNKLSSIAVEARK